MNVLVPVADGTEDLEAVAIIDVLRRAKAQVTIASVSSSRAVTFSQGLQVTAECLITDCVDKEYDLVVLPGGIPGVERLRDCPELIQILKRQNSQGKLYGAICAAPAVVLEHHALLDDKTATCHPGFADQLSRRDETRAYVVADKNCVTSRGAGTAIAFGLELVEKLFGPERREEVEKGMAIAKSCSC